MHLYFMDNWNVYMGDAKWKDLSHAACPRKQWFCLCQKSPNVASVNALKIERKPLYQENICRTVFGGSDRASIYHLQQVLRQGGLTRRCPNSFADQQGQKFLKRDKKTGPD